MNALKSVVLDLRNCHCPSGCCWLFKFLWWNCGDYWPDVNGDDDGDVDVKVFGLIDDNEKKRARRMNWVEYENKDRTTESLPG